MQKDMHQTYDNASLSYILHNPLFNQIPHAIIIADTLNYYIGVNQHACTLLGYRREELLTLGWHDLIFANDLAHTPLDWHDLYVGETLCEERRVRVKAGHVLHVEINACKLADGSLLTFVRDITEYRFLETMIQKRAAVETQLAKIVNAVPAAICSLRLHPDGFHTIPYANAAFQEILGLQLVDLILNNAPLFAHIDPADRVRFQQSIAQAAIDVTPLQLEYRIQHPDRGERWIEIHATPTEEPNGNPLWYGCLQDCTERKRHQERLYYQQNMESLGRVVAGIAHHFNNLLTPIHGYCELIQDQFAPDSEVQEDLQVIMQSSDRAALLTRQMLAVGRKQQFVPNPLNLNDLLADIWGQLEHLFSADYVVEFDLQPSVWTVMADVEQIAQVCTNIMLNARDAMPTGGRLVVKTRNVVGGDGAVRTEFARLHVPCVLVTITDTGSGMDAHTRSQVFEPFFTTKDSPQHTGLGLATAHGIIRQNGGDIVVESRPNVGTTFAFYLPSSEDTSSKVLPLQMSDTQHDQHKRVLVVEDDIQVQTLIRKILANLEYTILVASSREEALALLETYPNEIDLLVADAMMPHMSGLMLAEWIMEHKPNTKILLLSSYAEASPRYERVLASDVAFLPKPFSPSALVAKVRQILGAT